MAHSLLEVLVSYRIFAGLCVAGVLGLNVWMGTQSIHLTLAAAFAGFVLGMIYGIALQLYRKFL